MQKNLHNLYVLDRLKQLNDYYISSDFVYFTKMLTKIDFIFETAIIIKKNVSLSLSLCYTISEFISNT